MEDKTEIIPVEKSPELDDGCGKFYRREPE